MLLRNSSKMQPFAAFSFATMKGDLLTMKGPFKEENHNVPCTSGPSYEVVQARVFLFAERGAPSALISGGAFFLSRRAAVAYCIVTCAQLRDWHSKMLLRIRWGSLCVVLFKSFRALGQSSNQFTFLRHMGCRPGV